MDAYAGSDTSAATPAFKILGIPGSVHESSFNLSLLRVAAEIASPAAELTVYASPELATLASFDPAAELPPGAARLRGAVAGCDALLLATPEHNGSIPGGLKNAIDWVAAPGRRGPLRRKPVAVVGADTGEFGSDWAQADARKVLEVAGARVVGEGLSVERAAQAFDSEGALLDPLQADRLDGILRELIAEGRAPG